MTVNPEALTSGYMFGPSDGSAALLWPLLTSADPSETLAGLIVLEDRSADLPG
jgi:hypothetical protein